MIALKVLLFSKIQHLTPLNVVLFSNSARYNQLILKQRNPQSQPTENFKHFGRTSSVGEIIFECTELCTGETKHIRI